MQQTERSNLSHNTHGSHSSKRDPHGADSLEAAAGDGLDDLGFGPADAAEGRVVAHHHLDLRINQGIAIPRETRSDESEPISANAEETDGSERRTWL
jgi:hypothetical protein